MCLVWTLLFFMAGVAGHALLCRLPMRIDFVAKSILVGAPLGLLHGVVQWMLEGLCLRMIAAVIGYGFLFELYIFFFTLVSTSVSVYLLLKLDGRGLSASEIEELYSSRSMVDGRFEKLIRVGFLTESGDAYRVTSKARLVLAAFRTIRFFFKHPREDGMEKSMEVVGRSDQL